MLTRLVHSATRTATRKWNFSALSPSMTQFRSMGTLEESVEASQAYKNSCYLQIDFTINEEDTVYEAVQRFSAYNVGCLVTTDSKGKSSTTFIFWISIVKNHWPCCFLLSESLNHIIFLNIDSQKP